MYKMAYLSLFISFLYLSIQNLMYMNEISIISYSLIFIFSILIIYFLIDILLKLPKIRIIENKLIIETIPFKKNYFDLNSINIKEIYYFLNNFIIISDVNHKIYFLKNTFSKKDIALFELLKLK